MGFKLSKNVAGSSSFRWNRKKFKPNDVTQKQLKEMFDADCGFVIEDKKIIKKIKNDETKSNKKEGDDGFED